MKPFNEYLAEAEAKSGDDAAYDAFFKKTLKKFGVDNQNELSKEKQKEFYNEIEKNWKADDEED